MMLEIFIFYQNKSEYFRKSLISVFKYFVKTMEL